MKKQQKLYAQATWQSIEVPLMGLVPQGGSQKSRIQKSKVLWNKLFRAFQWSASLRRAVLVKVPEGK